MAIADAAETAVISAQTMLSKLTIAEAMLLFVGILAGGLVLDACRKLFVDAIAGGRRADDVSKKPTEYGELILAEISNIKEKIDGFEERLSTLEDGIVSEKVCGARLKGVQNISKIQYNMLRTMQGNIDKLNASVLDLISFLTSNRRKVVIQAPNLKHAVHSQGFDPDIEDEEL